MAQEKFLWSEAEQALYIPVHRYTSAFGPVVAGYVKRSFNPKNYRTLRILSGALWGFYKGDPCRGVQGEGEKRPVVLVEDVLSAIRVARAGWDCIALCGTELHPAAASFVLTEGYQRGIVFLDGDNPIVKMKARKIANRLPFPTRIVETGHDPKRYPNDQLQELLTD